MYLINAHNVSRQQPAVQRWMPVFVSAQVTRYIIIQFELTDKYCKNITVIVVHFVYIIVWLISAYFGLFQSTL